MIYLILAVLASSLISIVMRLGEGRIANNISTLAVNYVICLLLSLLYSFGGGFGGFSLAADGARLTLMLGLINGVCYVSNFILYQYNIHKNGVVMSSTFQKLGVLVPTIMAIVVFGERPGILQIAGICLAVAAILIVNGADLYKAKASGADPAKVNGDDPAKSGSKVQSSVTAPRALVFLLLIGGTGDAMSKVYEETGRAEFNSHFLLFTFVMALCLCTLTAIRKGQGLTKTDLLFGCCIGIPNYYSARFVLLSLSSVPAVVAYPLYSVGTIVVVALAGVLLFREKMTRTQWAAVAIVIAAMVLLNV